MPSILLSTMKNCLGEDYCYFTAIEKYSNRLFRALNLRGED